MYTSVTTYFHTIVIVFKLLSFHIDELSSLKQTQIDYCETFANSETLANNEFLFASVMHIIDLRRHTGRWRSLF